MFRAYSICKLLAEEMIKKICAGQGDEVKVAYPLLSPYVKPVHRTQNTYTISAPRWLEWSGNRIIDPIFVGSDIWVRIPAVASFKKLNTESIWLIRLRYTPITISL